MRNYQIMYYTGASISMLVGLWHFTVTWLFGGSFLVMFLLLAPFLRIAEVMWESKK